MVKVHKTREGVELRFPSTNEGCPPGKDTLIETVCSVRESNGFINVLKVSTKKQKGLIVLPPLKQGEYVATITEMWTDKRTAPFSKSMKVTFKV